MGGPQVKKLKYHVFFCTNERELDHPRGSCMRKGSESLLHLFKDKVKAKGLKDVRAQRAGCLDTCEHGPTVVVYPEGIWYGKVTPEDVDEIIESHLKNGRPVTRLLIPGK